MKEHIQTVVNVVSVLIDDVVVEVVVVVEVLVVGEIE